MGIPTATQADLLVYATNPTVAAGGSGSFDIVLESTADSGGDYHVGAFNTNIQVPTGDGISFTAVDQNTTDTYIFSGNPGAPTLTVSNLTSIDASVIDTYLGGAYFVVAPGMKYGLAHVTFSVASWASPTVPTQFVAGDTTIAGEDGVTGLSIVGPSDGVITVTGSSPVPEPGTLVMSGLMVLGGGLAARRKLHERKAEATA